MYSSEDIQVGGSIDSTLEFIRGGLGVIECRDQVAWYARPRYYPENYLRLSMFGGDELRRLAVQWTADQPVSRAHSRILMETWGWPLKHFKSLSELLNVIRDAVEGLSKLCYEMRS